MWNPVPLVGVLARPQCLSSPGCAVALVGCTVFAVMGNEPHGGIFGFSPLRGVRVRQLFLFSFPGRAVAFWGHASLAVCDNFGPPQAARSPWLVVLRSPQGAISCLWEVLGGPGGFLASPPASNFLLGGGDAGPPMSPSFLCSGGVRTPGEVGVLGHPGFWCRPGAGLKLSPGSQGVSRRALHSLRGPGPTPQTQKQTQNP